MPAMRAEPSVGSSMPHNIRITVDLPEPFGPRKPKMEPLATVKLTWSTAVKWPNRLVNSSHSIIVSAGILFQSPKLARICLSFW